MGLLSLRNVFRAFLALSVAALAPKLAARDAASLAADLAEGMEDGSSLTRLRLVIKSGSGRTTLNLQIKARRTPAKSEVLYQVLFPLSRKGESVLLSQVGTSTPEGYAYTPPAEAAVPLTKANLTGEVFGSDLSYQDLVENFFRWSSQNLLGEEAVDGTDCLILESKPGSDDSTPYGSVKTWVDPQKMVAKKVEKFDRSGHLVRRSVTLQTARVGTGRVIPTKLVVRRPGGSTETELDGSNTRHDVEYSDEVFTVRKMPTLR